MNIRKTVDYSELYAALDKLIATAMPQMALCYELGRLVSSREEKGAAVAAAEYLQARYPECPGFSPRSLRRMRSFFQAYENSPDLLELAMSAGWSRNVVILEAELTMEEREWYLRACCQFGWTKAELQTQIRASVHLEIALDQQLHICYNKNDTVRLLLPVRMAPGMINRIAVPVFPETQQRLAVSAVETVAAYI